MAHLPEITEIRLRLGEGVAGQVARTGKPLRVRSAADDARVAKRFDEMTGYRTRSLMAAPLCSADGHVIAVLELINKRVGEFDREDEANLGECARSLARLMLDTSLGSQLGPGTTQPLAYRFNNIVGNSAPMQQAYDLIERAARTDVTVLIRGESGTGKELFARAAHDNSPRADGPFVKVDCAALPDKLIENELFGHERGAYTGADQAADGQVAAAQGGTLMLDEIGELPLGVQGKLLRLLHEKTYLRVGGREPREADPGSSVPPIGTWRRVWRTANSARTCTTDCGWSRSRSRPSADEATAISTGWWITSCSSTAAATSVHR